MSRVYVISDLHLGHKKILEFEGMNREGSTVEEHDAILADKWASVINKRDLVYVLGDVAWTTQDLMPMRGWPGRKILVRGNHDKMHVAVYLTVFEDVLGVLKRDHVWLSHCPIAWQELRGCKSVHGHTHSTLMRDHYHQPDERYINVCVEQTGGYPVDFHEVIK